MNAPNDSLNKILKETFNSEVPSEVQTRLRKHLDVLRNRLDASTDQAPKSRSGFWRWLTPPAQNSWLRPVWIVGITLLILLPVAYGTSIVLRPPTYRISKNKITYRGFTRTEGSSSSDWGLLDRLLGEGKVKETIPGMNLFHYTSTDEPDVDEEEIEQWKREVDESIELLEAGAYEKVYTPPFADPEPYRKDIVDFDGIKMRCCFQIYTLTSGKWKRGCTLELAEDPPVDSGRIGISDEQSVLVTRGSDRKWYTTNEAGEKVEFLHPQLQCHEKEFAEIAQLKEADERIKLYIPKQDWPARKSLDGVHYRYLESRYVLSNGEVFRVGEFEPASKMEEAFREIKKLRRKERFEKVYRPEYNDLIPDRNKVRYFEARYTLSNGEVIRVLEKEPFKKKKAAFQEIAELRKKEKFSKTYKHTMFDRVLHNGTRFTYYEADYLLSNGEVIIIGEYEPTEK